MNVSSNALHNEIRTIATMKSLVLSRYCLLLSTALSMLYSLSHHYAVSGIYIFFFSLLCPTAMEQIFMNKKKKTPPLHLSLLGQQHDFSAERRVHLLWSFWLSNLLLITWTCITFLRQVPDVLARFLPGILLVLHVFIYVFFSYYYHFKFHYQLKNNRW